MCVTWPVGQGGRKSTYHAAWLSEFCACPECYDSVAVHYSWTKHFDPRGTTVAETKVIGRFIILSFYHAGLPISCILNISFIINFANGLTQGCLNIIIYLIQSLRVSPI